MVVNVLAGDINDVFNALAMTREELHRHMTRADLAIDYYNTNLKWNQSK